MRVGCLALVLAACARAPDAVTVCAAASLREIATEIGDAWARDRGARVTYRFESSDTLARQIREGAPCDVFLSADPRWAAEVRAIDDFPWVGNRLVCVRSKGSKAAEFAQVKRLALGSEGSPVGRYAAAAMKALGVAPPDGTIYGSNVRDVLSKVAEGAAEVGIVYATDVPVDPRVEIAFELPASVQPRIVYPVALLTERGRGLYEAFRAPAALAAAERRGFPAAR
ncbi:MAG TPA: molybdate ABC transporter substrate-binding protein [Planctomycetota bacterium]|nr:molybdate ABC transporter substrate-binding protein [Planctomycetota bacterium]